MPSADHRTDDSRDGGQTRVLLALTGRRAPDAAALLDTRGVPACGVLLPVDAAGRSAAEQGPLAHALVRRGAGWRVGSVAEDLAPTLVVRFAERLAVVWLGNGLSGTGDDVSPAAAALLDKAEAAGATVLRDPPVATDGERRGVVGQLKDHAGQFGTPGLRAEVEEAMPRIVALLHTQTGHDFRHFETSTPVWWVCRRMNLLKLDRPADYLQRVAQDAAEADALVCSLLIGVTSPLRAPETYGDLQAHVLPQRASRRRSAAEGPLLRPTDPSDRSGGNDSEGAMDDLERERLALRDVHGRNLRELEAANEDLRSGDEDLLSMNEALLTSKKTLQQADGALEQAHGELETFLRSTKVAMLILDAEDRILRYTPEATQLFDLLPGDVGRPLNQVTHRVGPMPPLPRTPPDGDAGGDPSAINTDAGRTYLRRTFPLTLDVDAPAGRVVTFQDVTELQAARNQVEASATFLERSLDALPLFAGVCTPDGVMQTCNGPALEAGGMPRDQVVGQRFWDCGWWSHDAAAGAAVRAAVELGAAGHSTTADYRYRVADGSVRWVSMTVNPMPGPGGSLSHLMLSGFDVTDRVEDAERIRLNEQRLSLVLSAGEMGLWRWEPDTGVLEFDAAQRRLWGFAPDEPIAADAAFARVHRDDLERLRSEMQKCIDGDVRYRYEFRIFPAPGEERVIAARGDAAARDAAGRATSMVGVNWDVTERHDRERAARESDQLRALALDAARLGAWNLDPATGRVRWDERCRAMFDGPTPAAAGTDRSAVLTLVHPEDRPRVEAALAAALDPTGDGGYAVEFRVLAGRRTRWLLSQGQAHVGDGTPRLTGVNMDITARRRLEDDLRRWRTMFLEGGWSGATIRPDGSDPIPLPDTALAPAEPSEQAHRRVNTLRGSGLMQMLPVDTDPYDRLTEVACRLLRVPVALVSLVDDSRQVFAGQTGLSEPCASDRQTPISHSFCAVVSRTAAPLVVSDATLNPLVSGNPAIDALGVRAYLGVPLFEPGGACVGALCAISNTPRTWSDEDLESLQTLGRMVTTEIAVHTHVSELQSTALALEAARLTAEKANRAKTEFLANMSHEIRTPMTAILGYADVLARHLKDPDNLTLVDIIRRSGRSLLTILNDILDLAKIEAGKLQLRLQRYAPEAVIEEVVSLMEVPAAEKGLGLDAVFEGPIPRTIECDPARLRQVLLNLVGNAIKFTERGAVRLVVALDATGPAVRLMIRVVDTGVGIADADLERLFRPFSQVDGSSERLHGGTGLGLNISRRLCRQMGGELTVESGRRAGSTFTVALPLSDADAAGVRYVVERGRTEVAAAENAGAAAAGRPPLAGRRVLVVDDRREIRGLVVFLLEEAGAQVTTRVNGREAVDHLRPAEGVAPPDYDAVILDMQMPVMDGYAAARALRAAGFAPPIVAVTAHAMPGEREKCLKAGCTAFATKPLDGEALLRILVETIGSA